MQAAMVAMAGITEQPPPEQAAEVGEEVLVGHKPQILGGAVAVAADMCLAFPQLTEPLRITAILARAAVDMVPVAVGRAAYGDMAERVLAVWQSSNSSTRMALSSATNTTRCFLR